MHPPITHHPKRILCIKLADLGDLVGATPALQALRAAHPQARIDLLVSPSSAGLLRGSRSIDTIITYDKLAFDRLRGLLDIRGLVRSLRFLWRLRAAKYDTMLLFHHCTTRWGTAKFAVLSWASGARVRAGLDSGCKGFLTHKTPDMGFGAMHESDYWLNVVALVGGDAQAGWWPQLPITVSHRERAAELLKPITPSAGPLVVIHPGAGAYSLARIWPTDGFAKVARGLIESHGAAIIVLGGPDEREMAARLTEMIGNPEPKAEGSNEPSEAAQIRNPKSEIRNPKRVLNLAGRTSIHETAAIIERCDLFLGNDSGPMHIAAAMQTFVVAVFGPSNRHAWGPYTPPGEKSIHTVVARNLPCQPCFYRAHSLGLREGCGRRPCLTGLSYERVLEACRQALSREKETRRWNEQ